MLKQQKLKKNQRKLRSNTISDTIQVWKAAWLRGTARLGGLILHRAVPVTSVMGYACSNKLVFIV